MMIKNLFNASPQKIKYGLERTHRMLKACGLQENNYLKIQIVGTNGKGTVAAFLSKILFDAGIKVGTYSSPHLIKINERIQINGKQIDDLYIENFLSTYNNQIDKISPSFFEIMTVLSIWYFNIKKVDIAIMETGLGGRLDSVTACDNQIVLFTSISMDHHDILGNTLEKITKEKAGAILNNKQICISVCQENKVKKILSKAAENHKNKITILNTTKKNKQQKFRYLYGTHQEENANLAQETIKAINGLKKTKIKQKQIYNSLYNTHWYGRFQIIYQNPKIIYDVAHNKASLQSFINSFINYTQNKAYKKKHLICAFESNKKILTFLRKYEKYFDNIICTETKIRSSMCSNKIAKIFLKKQNIKKTTNINNAIAYTLTNSTKKDIIAIIGSHFIAPSLNRVFKNCFDTKNKEY